MRVAIADIETDGLYEEVTKVHVIGIKDKATDRAYRYADDPRSHKRDGTIEQGLAHLDTFDLLVFHNGITYDAPVLAKVRGWKGHWKRIFDTMIVGMVLWPEVREWDMKRWKKGKFPGQLIGRYSLEAWGHRLGNHKGDFKGPWTEWTQEMEDYCVQDLEVTDALYERCLKEHLPQETVDMEMQVAWIVARQCRYGILFDQKAALDLYGRLVQRKAEIEAELQKVFRPRYLRDGKEMTPKRDNKKQGYCEGAPLQKVKLTAFNPGSRDHIAHWLKALRGWKPTEFTGDGKPKVDEGVINQLTYPEAKPLKEYLMVDKRIGQLAEGDEAWLKQVRADGRIRGRVDTCKAVTRRMAHSKPNLGQVPAAYSPWGPECRALFIVPEGKVQVGADADALELRDFAGYVAMFDGGAYVETVLKGDKSKGTDIHSVNCRALGMDPKGTYLETQTGRDVAKTWFYAFLYGAGDEKLGVILTGKRGRAAIAAGKKSRASFMEELPALGNLVEKVRKAAKKGYLKGLDGSHIKVRSEHAALNTLLQSCGAIQMKRALCIFDDSLQAAGLVPGVHYEFIANVHDEWQLEVDIGLEEKVGKLAVEAIRKAGESFGFRCPLDGQWKSGRNWYETH